MDLHNMGDSHTRVNYRQNAGFLERIGNSLVGILIGTVILIVASGLLFWNEVNTKQFWPCTCHFFANCVDNISSIFRIYFKYLFSIFLIFSFCQNTFSILISAHTMTNNLFLKIVVKREYICIQAIHEKVTSTVQHNKLLKHIFVSHFWYSDNFMCLFHKSQSIITIDIYCISKLNSKKWERKHILWQLYISIEEIQYDQW